MRFDIDIGDIKIKSTLPSSLTKPPSPSVSKQKTPHLSEERPQTNDEQCHTKSPLVNVRSHFASVHEELQYLRQRDHQSQQIIQRLREEKKRLYNELRQQSNSLISANEEIAVLRKKLSSEPSSTLENAKFSQWDPIKRKSVSFSQQEPSQLIHDLRHNIASRDTVIEQMRKALDDLTLDKQEVHEKYQKAIRQVEKSNEIIVSHENELDLLQRGKQRWQRKLEKLEAELEEYKHILRDQKYQSSAFPNLVWKSGATYEESTAFESSKNNPPRNKEKSSMRKNNKESSSEDDNSPPRLLQEDSISKWKYRKSSCSSSDQEIKSSIQKKTRRSNKPPVYVNSSQAPLKRQLDEFSQERALSMSWGVARQVREMEQLVGELQRIKSQQAQALQLLQEQCHELTDQLFQEKSRLRKVLESQEEKDDLVGHQKTEIARLKREIEKFELMLTTERVPHTIHSQDHNLKILYNDPTMQLLHAMLDSQKHEIQQLGETTKRRDLEKRHLQEYVDILQQNLFELQQVSHLKMNEVDQKKLKVLRGVQTQSGFNEVIQVTLDSKIKMMEKIFLEEIRSSDKKALDLIQERNRMQNELEINKGVVKRVKSEGLEIVKEVEKIIEDLEVRNKQNHRR